MAFPVRNASKYSAMVQATIGVDGLTHGQEVTDSDKVMRRSIFIQPESHRMLKFVFEMSLPSSVQTQD